MDVSADRATSLREHVSRLLPAYTYHGPRKLNCPSGLFGFGSGQAPARLASPWHGNSQSSCWQCGRPVQNLTPAPAHRGRRAPPRTMGTFVSRSKCARGGSPVRQRCPCRSLDITNTQGAGDPTMANHHQFGSLPPRRPPHKERQSDDQHPADGLPGAHTRYIAACCAMSWPSGLARIDLE